MSAKPKGNGGPAKPPEAEQQEEDNSEELVDSIMSMVDLTPEQLEAMEEHLEGKAKKPLGMNVACNGFFAKATGAQLIGQVVEVTTKQSDLNPDKEDLVLFVQGIALYPEDVKTKSGKGVKQRKGKFHGTFGYQIDAGSMALSSAGKGTRLHVQVKEMIDLSGGRTRWIYDFIRVR